MATITTLFGSGGAGLFPGGQTPSIADALRDIADDLAALRTKFVATLVKLDADAGVTDTDYAATQTPAALLTIKG
ncbi:MAG: hypothetical protein A2Y38_13890 [Spirochaetes bacterium GWB1_59_5]|nr:MAG: hypothetical protein A2Y38_13890 [Spirochaetes bacterium GWB1_59_5]